MARPKRTIAANAQTGAVQTKAVEVKKAAEPAVKVMEEAVKETVKTEVKAEIEKSVVVEFGGKKVIAKDILALAEQSYAKAHPETVVKTIELYISPEQNAAYYVVNGEGSDEFRIEL